MPASRAGTDAESVSFAIFVAIVAVISAVIAAAVVSAAVVVAAAVVSVAIVVIATVFNAIAAAVPADVHCCCYGDA